MTSIDLNADIGEGAPDDADLLEIVSSANICCGAHAGDPDLTQTTIEMAHAAHVRIGAHPGYPDRANFGRIVPDQSRQKTLDQIVTQVETFAERAARVGAKVSYVKLHGALYNQAAQDFDFARALFAAVHDESGISSFMVLAGSAMQRAAIDLNFVPIVEGFADRAYLPDGTLMPRQQLGAVHSSVDAIVAQALKLAKAPRSHRDPSDANLPQVTSICLHGDGRNALVAARAVRDALQANDITISASATSQAIVS